MAKVIELAAAIGDCITISRPAGHRAVCGGAASYDAAIIVIATCR